MKKLSILMALLIIVSCSNNEKSKNDILEAASVEVALEEKPVTLEAIAYEQLIESKLLDLSEKQALRESHPDFKIEKNEIELNGIIDNINILDPVNIDEAAGIVNVLVSYKNSTTQDTLKAHISSSILTIDGEQLKSTTVRFESNH